MQTGSVQLTAGGQILPEVKIQRGLFQGNALLSLLFLIAMIPLYHMRRKGEPDTISVNCRKRLTT